jgi:hypothetical protein
MPLSADVLVGCGRCASCGLVIVDAWQCDVCAFATSPHADERVIGAGADERGLQRLVDQGAAALEYLEIQTVLDGGVTPIGERAFKRGNASALSTRTRCRLHAASGGLTGLGKLAKAPVARIGRFNKHPNKAIRRAERAAKLAREAW